jgi:flagellar biosynthesis protein FlhF
MNIRRYLAPDMRTAFKLVREELGPDVVILSTRRVKGQIELTVASDQVVVSNTPNSAVREVSFPSLTPRNERPAETPVARRDTVARPAARSAAISDTMPVTTAAPVQAVPAVAVAARAAAAPAAAALSTAASAAGDASSTVASMSALDGELKALRRLLETQLAALAWNDLSRRAPVVAEVVQELVDVGLGRTLAADVANSIPPGTQDLESARRAAYQALVGRVPVIGDAWIEQGGTFAVVGPAGAGKTTAIAALAARWVMRNGAQGAALISAGESRFGVRENLTRVGRLVGLPVHTVEHIEDLPGLFEKLGERRFVIIDTAGYSPRNADFAQHIAKLQAALPGAHHALVLSAVSQIGSVRELISAYGQLGKLACILTHVDECTSLGGLLAALMESAVPVAYTVAGNRLLDDLRPARPDTLVELARELLRRHGVAGDGRVPSRHLEAISNVG